MRPRSSLLAASLGACALLALPVVGCGDDPTAPPREGATRLFVDTDLPTPEIASRLRIDLYRADGTWFDSREVDTSVASTFPASFDLAAPSSGAVAITVRLRVFPQGATRAYRGERFVPYAQVFAPPPAPQEETPRLLDGDVDRTPETEPLPSLTVDRLVTLRAEAGKQASVTVVLHGACVGVMADLATGASCVQDARTLEPLADPSDPTGPSHTDDLREPCDGVDPGPDRVCVPGGVFVLGDRRAPFIDDEDGFFLDMRTERVVRLPRFLVDRAEITVARYRAARKAGFKTSQYQPKDNPEELSEDPLSSTSCTYTLASREREGHPLNCLPWGAFRELCAYLGGDLPTEAQWEYVASSAGSSVERPYPWGDAEPSCDRAVYARAAAIQPDNCDLHPALPSGEVAKGDVTPLGVHDLGGSLSEFVIDGPSEYDGEAWIAQPFGEPLVPNAVKATDKTTDDDRYILRGGSWASPANVTRTTFRLRGSAASPFYGARCVYPVDR